MTQIVTVSAYRDQAYRDLHAETMIVDGGVLSGGLRTPSSDLILIDMAKIMLRLRGEHSGDLYFTVGKRVEWDSLSPTAC